MNNISITLNIDFNSFKELEDAAYNYRRHHEIVLGRNIWDYDTGKIFSKVINDSIYHYNEFLKADIDRIRKG